ncbi:MAG: hypothetical protein EAZ53_15280, partial [Bacteroidetes bacterium]
MYYLQIYRKVKDKYRSTLFRHRQVLAVVNSPNESATIWEETFRELQNRGVQSVGLVVSDGLTGIENAVTKVFTTA